MDERRATILIADDEQTIREALEKVLAQAGYRVLLAEDGERALDLARGGEVNLVLADLKMPGIEGLDLLKALKLVVPDLEVVMITGHGTIEAAVEAMKEGAYDFVTKPFKKMEILKTVRKALEKQSLVLENRSLHQLLADVEEKERVIGSSAAMQTVWDLVCQVAPSSANVLIHGESGTGKELIATAIHRLSPRRNKALVKVSCAALPETLLESELFGYERGAFTGAHTRKEGRFELADGGTLLLDEIGEVPLSLQVKLLRVLQDGRFERLGSVKTTQVDVRIIASTNKNLEEAIRQGTFREDLYYRLNVIGITLPGLRDRTEDIPLLAAHFIRLYGRKNQKEIKGISEDALEQLCSYPWPGNVRELENVIERAVILARGSHIGVADLPPHISRQEARPRQLVIAIGTPLEDAERLLIRETVRYCGGDKNTAAHLLGIASRTIYRKLEPRELGGRGGEIQEGEPSTEASGEGPAAATGESPPSRDAAEPAGRADVEEDESAARRDRAAKSQ
ncbi:MAG: sigma-54-dependent Fis family transcriptional regulator [Deltaproteobacteria bacterium]|nr:sigma-54-dependent Fis family transcriptional regulator [Deltaproteobacteria bacterium]